MKKTISLMLVLCLFLFSLCGCNNGGKSSEPDHSAEEIIDSILTNIENVESLYLECETDSSMSVMGSKVDSKSTVVSEVNIKEKVQYISMIMETLGNTVETECYIKENANGADVYLNANGNWIKQTAIIPEKVTELGISTDSYQLMGLYFEMLKDNCEISETTADGREYYVFTGKIHAGEEVLEKSSLGNTLHQLIESGLSQEQIEEIISNVGEFEVTLYVDKETLLPTQFEVDITEATQNIMTGLADVLGESGEIKVEKNVAVSKYSQYNEIGEITIPEEVLNAEEVALY